MIKKLKCKRKKIANTIYIRLGKIKIEE